MNTEDCVLCRDGYPIIKTEGRECHEAFGVIWAHPLEEKPNTGEEGFVDSSICETCDGTGEVEGRLCKICGGKVYR
jgi:hypothetical protein